MQMIDYKTFYSLAQALDKILGCTDSHRGSYNAIAVLRLHIIVAVNQQFLENVYEFTRFALKVFTYHLACILASNKAADLKESVKSHSIPFGKV